MRPVQYFTEEYLELCNKFSVKEILQFIENFKNLSIGQKKVDTKLISIKIETDLLDLFKNKSKLENQRYQTKIKELMRQYCLD
jgi:uncharacterized protein (DUF4415 family)